CRRAGHRAQRPAHTGWAAAALPGRELGRALAGAGDDPPDQGADRLGAVGDHLGVFGLAAGGTVVAGASRASAHWRARGARGSAAAAVLGVRAGWGWDCGGWIGAGGDLGGAESGRAEIAAAR